MGLSPFHIHNTKWEKGLEDLERKHHIILLKKDAAK